MHWLQGMGTAERFKTKLNVDKRTVQNSVKIASQLANLYKICFWRLGRASKHCIIIGGMAK